MDLSCERQTVIWAMPREKKYIFEVIPDIDTCLTFLVFVFNTKQELAFLNKLIKVQKQKSEWTLLGFLRSNTANIVLSTL